MLKTALQCIGWGACVVYSTIPAFWLLIHPQVHFWRSRNRSPYLFLLPLWVLLWVLVVIMIWPFHHILLYDSWWTWIPALGLFALGICIYRAGTRHFTPSQLGGIPEILPDRKDQRLVVIGIRGRVRHPIYLGHLCELLAWSIGTGLAICFALTAFAVLTGAVMIRMEDAELEARFGAQYHSYRNAVPAILPRRTVYNPELKTDS